MENKKKIIMMSALLLVLFVVVIGITYAVYTFTGNSTLNTIDLGRISMSYTEPSNAYILDNALPMTDEEGKGQNNYFEFTVTSHATTKESDSVGITIPYEINISDIAIDEGMLELSKSLMKVNLVKVDGMTENEVVVPTLMSQLSQLSTNDGAMVVYQTEDVHKNGSTTITSKYRLRAWITPEFDASDTDNTYQYKFRVNINSHVEALQPGKPLRTLIMNQGVVSSGDGLYVSTETNDNLPTYYYHGAVENNYVDFAGLTWRVVRINEDGTIKMIINDFISGGTFAFNPNNSSYEYMYYSASDVDGGIKKKVDDWYANTLETDYDDYIATTNFCEAAKVKYDSSYTSGNATTEVAANYTANFKCEEDGNGKQYVSAKAGLITADEVVMAGIPLKTDSQTYNTNTYLQNSSTWWTMSPNGVSKNNYAAVWEVSRIGYVISNLYVNGSSSVRPVISLNADTLVTGSGASGDMWIVQ